MKSKNKQIDIMKFEMYVKDILNSMKTYLYLDEYTIEIEFLDEDHDDCFAEIATDIIYLSALIKIYPVTRMLYRKKKYFQVFNHLVHEICHLFTEPINAELCKYVVKGEDNALLLDVTERQTQRITIAIARNTTEEVWNPELR